MTMKKNFFEKIGLVQGQTLNQTHSQIQTPDVDLLKTPVETEVLEDQIIEEEPLSFVEDVKGAEQLMLPKDIYEKFKLSFTGSSIFKIEELDKNLPDTLPEDTRRQSIVGILQVTGLMLDNLILDAEDRIFALDSVQKEVSKTTEGTIKENDDQIIELTAKIDELKEQNISRRKLREDQEKIINEELDRISKILDFVTPHNHQGEKE